MEETTYMEEMFIQGDMDAMVCILMSLLTVDMKGGWERQGAYGADCRIAGGGGGVGRVTAVDSWGSAFWNSGSVCAGLGRQKPHRVPAARAAPARAQAEKLGCHLRA